MKRIKKMLCLMLVLVTLFSLSGCSWLDSQIKDIKGE